MARSTQDLITVLNVTDWQRKSNPTYQVFQGLITNLVKVEKDLAAVSATASSASTASSGAITQLTGHVFATGPGSVVATLSTTGVTAGTYGSTTAIPVFTVNQYGRLTFAGTVANAGTSGVTALTGDVFATGPGSVVSTLSTTGVVAGTYGSTTSYPIITVDAKGRITTATTASLAGMTGITQLTGDVLAGPGSGSVAATLSTTGVVAGTYGSATAIPVLSIDAKGRVTTATTTTFTTGSVSGAVAKYSVTQSTATSTGTTTIPFDDTIPQNTEGTQFMSVTYTPTTTANRLNIRVWFVGSLSVAVSWIIAALFQDSGASAIAANASFINTATAWVPVGINCDIAIASTAATTFTVRAGCNTAATVTFNGQGGARIFGGVLQSSITITEYTP